MVKNLKIALILCTCILMLFNLTACSTAKNKMVTNNSVSKNNGAVITPFGENTNLPEVTTEPDSAVPIETTGEDVKSTQAASQNSTGSDALEYEDYQIAYAAFMQEVWAADNGEDISEPWYSYSLYDIDKDDIPELLVQYGTCEADFYTVIYSYIGGEVKELNSFSSGHTALYTWPGDNGIMLFYGQMGYEYVTHAVLKDGELTQEVLSEQDIGEGDYSDPQDFIEGSAYINQFYTYITMPIYRYTADQKPCGSTSFTENTEVRNTFDDVLFNGASLYACSTDGFGDASGLMSMNQFLSDGSINQYDGEYSILKYSLLDINGDGQTEILLQLGTDGTMSVLAILSYDDGTVYCYYIVYAQGSDFLQNGLIYQSLYEEGDPEAVAFNKTESYTYYINKNYMDGILPVEWQDFSEYSY